MKLSRIIPLGIAVFLMSCGENTSVNTPDVMKAVKSREIKKITEVEILSKANEIGEYLANAAQKTLGQNLKQQIQENGVEKAIGFCNVNAYSLVDTLEMNYNARIKRASLRVRNPKDQPDELEKSILDAYQYNIEKGLELSSNIQMAGDSILFTKAITIPNGLCLNCHGTPGEQVKTEHYELLKTLYPNDNAVNHKIGDLRGMWSIKMDKASIVRSL